MLKMKKVFKKYVLRMVFFIGNNIEELLLKIGE